MIDKALDFLNTDKMVKNSFYLTYVFLMTTATITFIEAMRTKDNKVRQSCVKEFFDLVCASTRRLNN